MPVLDWSAWSRRTGPLYPGLVALGYLTRLPVLQASEPTADELRRSGPWFPVIGALLGALLAVMATIVLAMGPVPAVAAGLVLVAGLLLTGGLYELGLLHSAGELARATSRVTSQVISHVASGLARPSEPSEADARQHLGILALVSLLGLRLLGLLGTATSEWLTALLIANVIARWAALIAGKLGCREHARHGAITVPDPGAALDLGTAPGLGSVSWSALGMTSAATLIPVVVLGGLAGLAAMLACALVAAASAVLLEQARGSLSRRHVVAIAALCEVLVLLVFAFVHPARISPWIRG